MKGDKYQGQEIEHYFVIYSDSGEKVINLEPYLNHNRRSPGVRVNNQQLIRRIVEAVNGNREIRLNNVMKEVSTV